ncbi:MAG TPA: DUF1549 and DUF1553 domain-containing protein, partial [Isosphaeraceae bacterium]
MIPRFAPFGATLWLAVAASASAVPAAEVLAPASQRFADPEVREVPDFQKHILPLMGRLGCNTRSCHGSFQGQGGFRLSLFGYDFKMDHEALLLKDAGRVDVETPELSKILQKPTLAIPHKGGKRMEEESWQYTMFSRWIEDGAKGATRPAHFERLEVTPGEIVFREDGQPVPLRVIAHWDDGRREDVTCISRFRTNDESIAEVSEDGVVTSLGQGDTHVVAFYDNGVAVTQVLRPVSEDVGPRYPAVPTPTRIDALIVAKLRKLGIAPSELATDAEFLRRVSLDMTGTLPTPAEVDAFLADRSPAKRAAKVDELLERPTYAAKWTNVLCDITGATPRAFAGQGPLNTQFARDWYKWIHARVRANTPYDELVAGIVLATSRRPGQSYDDFIAEQGSYYRKDDQADFASRDTMPYYWARRNVRKPEEMALNFSYAFLGVRLECAQCHKHPFDQWTQDDFNGFTAFFNSVRYGTAPDARPRFQALQEELGLKGKNNNQQQKLLADSIGAGRPIPWQEVFVTRGARVRPAGLKGQPAKVRQQARAAARVITPKVLGGEEVSLEGGEDPRRPLMEWMRDEQNPYFARALVNRIWAQYFGTGIINPPDDMNLANPPSNAPLLDYLAGEFIRRGFDMKWLHREIATSLAYQRSWRTNATNRLDERNFSRAVVRRLPAEVLLDAVAQATSSSEALSRATSDLEARGIGPNAAAGPGRRGGGDYAAAVFGRSTRDANCDCSRSDEPNLLQSIFLQNDQQLLTSLVRPDGWLAERTGAATRARTQARPGKGQDLAQQIDVLQRRLEKLKQDAPQAERLQSRLKALRAELQSQSRSVAVVATKPVDPAQVEPIVAEAYLRTLSRRPTADEIEVARAYFAASGSESKGLRDL